MSTTSTAHDADRDAFTEQMLAWFAQGEDLATLTEGPHVLYEDERGARPAGRLRLRVGSVLLALVVVLWLAV